MKRFDYEWISVTEEECKAVVSIKMWQPGFSTISEPNEESQLLLVIRDTSTHMEPYNDKFLPVLSPEEHDEMLNYAKAYYDGIKGLKQVKLWCANNMYAE